MDNVCRLCCSTRFVNNYIFDEENALHLKMSLYLPIKILKNDPLPQKICDKCSCKVNDLYQFCNETMEAQSKLQTVFNITDIKDINLNLPATTENDNTLNSKPVVTSQSTQTEEMALEQPLLPSEIKIKEEPKPVKEEEYDDCMTPLDTFDANDSDSSENMKLIDLKLAKTNSLLEEYASVSKEVSSEAPKPVLKEKSTPELSPKKNVNGKKGRKRKVDLKDWTPFMQAMPEGTSLTVIKGNLSQQLKLEMKEEVEEVIPSELGIVGQKVKMCDLTFCCCVCFMETDSRVDILKHYRRHADQHQTGLSPPPPPSPIDEPTKCAICGQTIGVKNWASHWRKHFEREHRPYRCSICGNTFRDHNAIFRHGLTHKSTAAVEPEVPKTPENRFLCDLCPEEFYYMKLARAHRLRAHPESITSAFRLRCAVCSRTFAHLNSLRRHVRGHSGKRDFLCNICGKSLTSKEHLKFHIRIHENVKPNVCKTCGKAFVKKTNLTMHERVHTGEKPYACSHCGKSFSQRSTLVIHERYHSGARPYVCKLCGRGFVAKGLLSMHLKVACI